MMKCVKGLIWVLVALVVFVVTALLALPLWIGSVVPPTASAIVPKKTGTPFKMGSFALNPYAGCLVVRDVALMNPAGCEQKIAFSLGSLDVEVDPATALSDTVVIRRLAVKDVFCSIVKTPDGTTNWRALQARASGDAEKSVVNGSEPKMETKAENASARKFIIDELVIDGVVLEWGKVTLPLKVPVRLTGIGRSSGGVDWEGLWIEVRDAVLKSFGSLGAGLQGLGADLNADVRSGLGAVLEKATSTGSAGSKKVQKAARVLRGLFAD